MWRDTDMESNNSDLWKQKLEMFLFVRRKTTSHIGR
jgi:hypothetical protein